MRVTMNDTGAQYLRQQASSVVGHQSDDFLRQIEVGQTRRMLRVGDRDGNSAVAALANLGEYRQAREHRQRFLGRHLVSAAMPKDLIALAAVRTDEDAHVFDDAEDRAM